MKRLAALCFIVLALGAGCDDQHHASSLILSGKTMGTVWRVSVVDVDPARKVALQQQIQQQLDADDRELSTWKQDSVLSLFNRYRGTSPWPVSKNMADIVTLALRIGKETQGAMDITIGPLVNLWGFGPDKQPLTLPGQAQIDAARSRTGLQHLKVINGYHGQWLQKDLADLSVDLSTVGEGFAADHLAKLLEKEGIHRYLASVGGAVMTRGRNAQGQPWRVAIQKPVDTENAISDVVALQGNGISTAGSYRNYYERRGKRFSHVIDPLSGRPVEQQLVSVTVIADSAMEADGWDTGLMVMGRDRAISLALKRHLAVYLISRENGHFSHWMSPAFSAFLLKKAAFSSSD